MATVTLSNTTVIEHPQVGTIVGFLGVTGSGASQNPTFRVIDPGSGRFEIKAINYEGIWNWVLVVKNNVSGDGSSLFDFENNALNKFNFKIAILGDFGDVISTTPVTISVTDNTAPTEINLSNSSVVEHAQTGTEIGYIEGYDPDDGDTLTYTLTEDAGGRFAIADGILVVKDGSLLDHQAASSHQIKIEVEDSEGNVYTETLTINVSDAVEVRKDTATNDRPVDSAGANLFKDLSGNDNLVGTVGADVINGDAGNDKISGLGGDDIISGGLGKDQLTGGPGKDTFVFDAAVRKGAFDQVTDFNSADDTLQFNLSALKSLKVKAFKEGKLPKKFFTIGTESKDKNDYVYYDKKNGLVYLDADGSGAMKGVQFLKLKPGTAVSADDFLFV